LHLPLLSIMVAHFALTANIGKQELEKRVDRESLIAILVTNSKGVSVIFQFV